MIEVGEVVSFYFSTILRAYVVYAQYSNSRNPLIPLDYGLERTLQQNRGIVGHEHRVHNDPDLLNPQPLPGVQEIIAQTIAQILD